MIQWPFQKHQVSQYQKLQVKRSPKHKVRVHQIPQKPPARLLSQPQNHCSLQWRPHPLAQYPAALQTTLVNQHTRRSNWMTSMWSEVVCVLYYHLYCEEWWIVYCATTCIITLLSPTAL